jgi:hypothetical protein
MKILCIVVGLLSLAPIEVFEITVHGFLGMLGFRGYGFGILLVAENFSNDGGLVIWGWRLFECQPSRKTTGEKAS